MPQMGGGELATAMRRINPSQIIVLLAFDYANANDVPCPAELKDVSVLTDVRNFRLQRLLERIRVHQATNALTAAELLKLQKFAAFKIKGMGRAACGRTADDLLVEAQLRTLMGAESSVRGRHWNKDVDFVRHLAGVMRSVANSWKRKFGQMQVHLECEVVTVDAEGYLSSPLNDVPSEDLTADETLISKETEQEIFYRLRDDALGTRVLRSLMLGMTKDEIIRECEIDSKKYQAVRKRLRTKLLSRTNQRGGYDYGR